MIMKKLKQLARQSPLIYRAYLHWRGYRPSTLPNAPWHNAVLRNDREVEQAHKQVEELKLMPHGGYSGKVWDMLAMLDCILKNTNPQDHILDAGAEGYSSTLPNLFLYGYSNLVGLNLGFEHTFRRGPIVYEHGDITHTRFADETFAAVACQSVIEHGVNISDYFAEMARILKPGGCLITSTDYYIDPIDTGEREYFGVPVKIYAKDDILEMLRVAAQFKLIPVEPALDLSCDQKPVNWLGLDYTFIIFTLKSAYDRCRW